MSDLLKGDQHGRHMRADLLRDIKVGSSGFINERKWIRGKFPWQDGLGAFSCAHSQIDHVPKYIRNQEEQHNKRTFKEENRPPLQGLYLRLQFSFYKQSRT